MAVLLTADPVKIKTNAAVIVLQRFYLQACVETVRVCMCSKGRHCVAYGSASDS